MDVKSLLEKIAEFEQIEKCRGLLSIEKALLELEKNYLVELQQMYNNELNKHDSSINIDDLSDDVSDNLPF